MRHSINFVNGKCGFGNSLLGSFLDEQYIVRSRSEFDLQTFIAEWIFQKYLEFAPSRFYLLNTIVYNLIIYNYNQFCINSAINTKMPQIM